MGEKQVQVNIRLAESSADRLKGLAEQAGLKLGSFVERMIAVYSDDSKLLQDDSKAGSWESVAEELRGLIADQDVRLNALEVVVMTGLNEGGGKVRVTLQPAENEAVGAVETNDDASSHQDGPLTPTAPSMADYERQIDEKIIALRKEGLAIKKIQAALRIGQKRVCKAIKDAELKE